MRVLIPGIASGLGRKLALRLFEAGHEVIGIDARIWPDAPRAIELHRADIRKRAAEEIFRKRRPEAVVHLATVGSLVVRDEERTNINLGGTRAVFDHCRTWGVRHVVFVGRHTYYGAGPDAPLYHREDEPPGGVQSFPELSDLVAADLYAATALWRMPELATTILRVCYTLGPTGHGTLAKYLRGRRVPTLLGFDPLYQFMHEDDTVDAILLALEKRPRGVFNVAGPQPVPLSKLVRETGRTVVPLPEFLFNRVLGKAGLPRLAPGATLHVQYPVVVDDGAFREATGFQHQWDEIETMKAFASAFPVRSR